jgi:hypothetical protein
MNGMLLSQGRYPGPGEIYIIILIFDLHHQEVEIPF